MKKVNQVNQSKCWFWEALYQLMQEHPYETITIKQLSDQAQLDRRTFYRHFSSKNDVLNYYIQRLLRNHFQELKKIDDYDEESIICQHFHFILENRSFLLLLKKNNLFSFLLESYSQYNELFKEIFKTTPFKPNKVPYRESFKAGGFINIISEWIEKEEPESPELMAKIVTSFYSYSNNFNPSL